LAAFFGSLLFIHINLPFNGGILETEFYRALGGA